MSTQPLDGTEFPAELVVKPTSLIGIAGLDIINNAIHKSIWDSFSNNRRPDRAPVSFKSLTNSYDFPVVKPKRNSYEWYIPKGILKKNWMNKHLYQIPAVIVIFYDLEWNDVQWNEKVIECASRVQFVRAAIEGHMTKIAVVIVQSGLSPPPSEFMLGAERAQSLCAACEIQSKALFVLPHGDRLMNYTLSLENAFYDLAQSYYHYETKTVKSHREHLNKTTHLYLYVRHQFKIGFLNELKHDLSTAHKHYMHAYENLSEIRIVDTNAFEVKTISGYINYKLCKLLFLLNLPRDSITQFRNHIERFKSITGYGDLVFEHYAWISRQYSAFGELFDEAIRAGLPAIQSQHPGFYYQQAAKFSVLRRQAMQTNCADVKSYPTGPDPLEGFVEFYGQRPWRPGRLSADPHDPLREQAAIQALQYKERQFIHSVTIINLLGNAITQFKTFHSPRMRKQLIVEMANEYYLCADYGKALTLLTHMLWDYRREKWWVLASHILYRALCCAYLSANIQDYISLAVEALSKHIVLPQNDKMRILNNILLILKLNKPESEPTLQLTTLPNVQDTWRAALEKDFLNIGVDMSTISSFLEIKPRFVKNKYKLDETVEIELFVRLTSIKYLEISDIFITIASSTETIEIPVIIEPVQCGSSNIKLNAAHVEKYFCPFKPNTEDNGSELHIKTVTFCIQKDKKAKLMLNFNMNSSHSTDNSIRPELLHFFVGSKSEYDFDSITPQLSAHIIPRDSNILINVNYADPALQGEWFPCHVDIKNCETADIVNVNMMVTLGSSIDNTSADNSTELCLDPSKPDHQNPLNIPLTNLSPSSDYKNTFYLKSTKVSTLTVLIKINYITTLPSDVQCAKEYPLKIAVVKPFEVSCKFVSLKFEPLEKCFVDDPFIIMPIIKILSPWKLIIEATDLELSENYEFEDDEKGPNCLRNVTVEEGAMTVDSICLHAKATIKEPPPRVGIYNIKWKRYFNNGANISTSILSSAPLHGLICTKSPVNITVIPPDKGDVESSKSLNYKFKCTSATPTKISFNVENADAFMFSGYKSSNVTVCPGHDNILNYGFRPLLNGDANLPKLRLTSSEAEESEETGVTVLEELFKKNVPQHVYILPPNKE